MLTFCGYFPKLIMPVPAGFEGAELVDIACVSDCISKGPPDRLDGWRFNPIGLFDTVEAAEATIPQGRLGEYDLYGYRILDEMFDEGRRLPSTIATQSSAAPGPEFEPLGYDAANRSVTPFFECSALSCNGGWRTFATNEHCLFRSLEEAVQGAIVFSAENWEPGPYFVLEVLRRCRAVRL